MAKFIVAPGFIVAGKTEGQGHGGACAEHAEYVTA